MTIQTHWYFSSVVTQNILGTQNLRVPTVLSVIAGLGSIPEGIETHHVEGPGLSLVVLYLDDGILSGSAIQAILDALDAAPDTSVLEIPTPLSGQANQWAKWAALVSYVQSLDTFVTSRFNPTGSLKELLQEFAKQSLIWQALELPYSYSLSAQYSSLSPALQTKVANRVTSRNWKMPSTSGTVEDFLVELVQINNVYFGAIKLGTVNLGS